MFMHFWAIPAGMAAVSVPFIVHWLTKPRPTRMPLSTIRFVKEVVQQRRARNRIRDLLILLLRAAAVILFAFVLARPLAGHRATPAGDADARTVRIVLLDISQSMAAEVKRHSDPGTSSADCRAACRISIGHAGQPDPGRSRASPRV